MAEPRSQYARACCSEMAVAGHAKPGCAKKSGLATSPCVCTSIANHCTNGTERGWAEFYTGRNAANKPSTGRNRMFTLPSEPRASTRRFPSKPCRESELTRAPKHPSRVKRLPVCTRTIATVIVRGPKPGRWNLLKATKRGACPILQ